jgi:hypothetical protein
LKEELSLYVPASKQTTEPGVVAAAVPVSVFGALAVFPELLSLPKGEAKSVQSDANPVLVTVTVIGKLIAVTPAWSVTFAEIV